MAKPARSLRDLPELAGWLTFGEAAKKMGVTVERVRQLASEPNRKLTTAHRLGQRPIGIVREAEVDQWIGRKQAREQAREPDGQGTLDELVVAGRDGADV